MTAGPSLGVFAERWLQKQQRCNDSRAGSRPRLVKDVLTSCSYLGWKKEGKKSISSVGELVQKLCDHNLKTKFKAAFIKT